MPTACSTWTAMPRRPARCSARPRCSTTARSAAKRSRRSSARSTTATSACCARGASRLSPTPRRRRCWRGWNGRAAIPSSTRARKGRWARPRPSSRGRGRSPRTTCSPRGSSRPGDKLISVMDTCIDPLAALTAEQAARNQALLARTPFLGPRFQSEVLPFTLDFTRREFTAEHGLRLAAMEKEAARTAIESLVSLARVNDIDHLGGGLELIPALLMTLAYTDYERVQYTFEHGHTSIGYYAALATLGFLDKAHVVDGFRRSLDIAGHVSWVPGGTELSSGRLGVMMPVGTGLALGLKAHHAKGPGSLVVCHTGDAGWISGQSLNGFNGAAFHGAPIVFVMHRNGIQLSGSTRHIMDRDPRPIIASFGIRILEIPSLLDRAALFNAYCEAFASAQSGHATLIYPVGFGGDGQPPATVADFGARYGIVEETATFAADHKVPVDTKIWIPGSLMSFRDVTAMLQCLFYVNDLPGGEAHHDGGMKGRDGATVLSNRMLALTAEEKAALARLQGDKKRTVVTTARPA